MRNFIKDERRGLQVQYHIALAHSLAVREFHKAKEKGYLLDDAQIGLINAFAPPYTKENPTSGTIFLIWLHNRLIKGKPIANFFSELSECSSGINRISFYYFPILPASPGDGVHNRWWLDLCTSGTLPQDVIETLSRYGLAPEIPWCKEVQRH